VQVVHYPLLRQVGGSQYVLHQHKHMQLTSYVVGPLMFTELGASICLLLLFPEGVLGSLASIGLALLVVIWCSTLLLQGPRHEQLRCGWNEEAHRGLVRSNWIRTIAWTLRSINATFIVSLFLVI